MRYTILVVAAMVITACGQQPPQLTVSEVLTGTWDNTVNGRESGDDPFTFQLLEEEYEQDGTYRATGLVELRDAATGKAVVSISGPDHGTWAIVDGKLEVTLTSSDIDSFESTMPGFTRAAYEAVLADSLHSPDVYEIVSVQENEIVLRDDDGSVYTLTR